MYYIISFTFTCLFISVVAAGYENSPYFDHQSTSYAIVSIGNFCAWYFNLPATFLDKIFNISESWGIGTAPYGLAGYIISYISWSAAFIGYAYYKGSQEDCEYY